MKVLAVIPARAGSTRLPDKNILSLDGTNRTLVDLAAECAHAITPHVMVSTDYGRSFMPEGAIYRQRPDHLCGPAVDLCDVTKDALQAAEDEAGSHFDIVVTLQPATPLRSPTLLREMLDTMVRGRCRGAITMAKCVPWTWRINGGNAYNSWFPGPYPRSQDVKYHDLQEINCAQMATRDVVLSGKRWDLPLLITELPHWAVLDIDTPADLEECRRLWPALKAEFDQRKAFPFHIAQQLTMNPRGAA